MTIATKNGTKPEQSSEPSPGLSLGLSAMASGTSGNALTPYLGSPGGALSGVGAISLSLPQVLGHSPTIEEMRIAEQVEEQSLAIVGQGFKLRLVEQQWASINQQVGVTTAQTFALLTALKHLSSDPDYQAWWASWSKYAAERYINTQDDLLVVGAHGLAEVLAQSVQPPGILVSLWNSLFGTGK